jgi:uncharacterized membrane protein YoaK (UPF0700 family)
MSQISDEAPHHRPRKRTRSLRSIALAVVAHRRAAVTDALLATLLAAVAGAVNAGGFFVVGQYTSHMTGYLAQAADNLAIGNYAFVGTAAVAVISFIFGAGLSAFLVNWTKVQHYKLQYSLPLGVQGIALFIFSFSDAFVSHFNIVVQLMGLCILMGMQNATITKLSKARIRTTHATGMVTDIGIELGRAVFGVVVPGTNVRADGRKLGILLRLVLAFLCGGVFGALGFAKIGFLFAMPLAIILFGVALPSLVTHARQTTM